MGHERIILCSGVNPPGISNRPKKILRLNLWKSKDGINVTLPVSDLDKKFWQDITPTFLDLIEIASYVYTADQAVGRGGKEVETFGAGWRRSLIFHIPVRVPELWQSPKVKEILTDTVSFLSDDYYEFHFYPAQGAPEYQQYLHFTNAAGKSYEPQQVVLYSGGLDSLAGAITEALDEKHRAVLVGHRPTLKFETLREDIAQQLAKRAGDLAPLYVPVRIHKDSEIGTETTQRVRSFLYASLAATVAQMVGLDGIRFYENGVVSLNLPPCEQIIGSRATRTTHPKVLRGFQDLFSEISGKKFTVENPFRWKTKGEIIKLIVDHDCEGMIKPSRSCASTWERTSELTHCGICSQCVDRRVAMIATEAEEYDPVGQYEVDIVTESVLEEKARIMMVSYFERANEFRSIKTADQLLEKYDAVADALPYADINADSALSKILGLHQRHAVEVRAAAVKLLQRHADDLLGRTLPDDCLVRILNDTNSATVLPAVTTPEKINGDDKHISVIASESKDNTKIHIGRMSYLPGFNDVWLGDEHYDLRMRHKARFCIEFLVSKLAYNAGAARHFLGEIDPYVRNKGNYLPAADIKIDHYFNDQSGRLPQLRKDLIRAAGRNGKFYLNTN